MKKIMMMLALGIVLLLAACGGDSTSGDSSNNTGSDSNSGSEDKSEKQTVTFWHSMGGAGQEALNSIVEDFNNSQEEIQVNAEYQGTYDESLTKFNAVAGTDSAPTMIQTFEIGTMSMINSGNIKPIQELIDADGYDMSGLEENIVNYYSLDGT